MFNYPCQARLSTDKNVVNPIIITMLSRIKQYGSRVWGALKDITKVVLEILKFALIGYVIFIGVPSLYELTNVHGRLDANIYDLYGILILLYLAYRVHELSHDVKELKKPEHVYLNVEDDKIDDDEWFKIT